MRPYPNTRQSNNQHQVSQCGDVIESVTTRSQAADMGHSVLNHAFMAGIQQAEQLQVQIILNNLHGEAQVQTTFNLEVLWS